MSSVLCLFILFIYLSIHAYRSGCFSIIIVNVFNNYDGFIVQYVFDERSSF